MPNDTVAQIETRYSSGARRPITLAGLAENWLTFANDIGAGYWGTIDEFTNDMTTRDMLEEALQQLGDRDRKWLIGLVEPGDGRYTEVTAADPSGRLSQSYRHDDHWWWHRWPLVPGELATYVEPIAD
jgi:hypothetical protein